MYARQTTDRLTTDGLVCGRGVLYGISGTTNGTNDVTIKVYDSLDASGKIARTMKIPAARLFGSVDFSVGIMMNNGIYVDVEGTGGAYWITFSID